MNTVVLIGNLVDDPTVRKNATGIAVCKFKIATSNGKDRQGNDRAPDYHNVTVWGRNKDDDGMAADCMQYLKKGAKVGVKGKLTENKWQTPAGEDRKRTEVIAENVEFLSRGETNGN